MNEKYEKLDALLADEEKAEKVFVEDIQQTLENLSREGIDLTKDELAELARGVMAGLAESDKNDELSEELLENVAGGSSWLFIMGHHHAVGGQKRHWFWKHFSSYNNGYDNGLKEIGLA